MLNPWLRPNTKPRGPEISIDEREMGASALVLLAHMMQLQKSKEEIVGEEWCGSLGLELFDLMKPSPEATMPALLWSEIGRDLRCGPGSSGQK